MHWLTKYINKKCHAHSEYALHNIPATLFNNKSAGLCTLVQQPSLKLVPTGMPLLLDGWLLNNVALLWGAYYCTSCLCTCQPVHSCIEPSLHQLDFFLEILLWRVVSVRFWWNQFVTWYRPYTCGWCIVLTCVHQQMASKQPVHSAPSVSPTKSAGDKFQLHSKQTSNKPSPENFRTIGGYFRTIHILADKRRWTILTFNRFWFATLK